MRLKTPTLSIALIVVLVLLATGCSSGTRTVRVPVAPRVELRAYPIVGLVTFSSNAQGELDRLAAEKFLQAVQAAQPGCRVIELGPEAQVLASVNRHGWDAAAMRAVKEAHGVDALVLGRIDVKRSKPDVQLSTMLRRLSVRSDVDATLTARLVETASGATVWTNSASCTTNLAHASFNDRGQGHFGASDAEAAYGAMLDGLVDRLADDFRVHYITRRVPRDQVMIAGAGE